MSLQMTSNTTQALSDVAGYLSQLRNHRDDLAFRYHVDTLGLFGSRVRGTERVESDLDVLVTFSETPTLYTLVALQDELTALLGVPVDLVMKTALKPALRERILRDVVDV